MKWIFIFGVVFIQFLVAQNTTNAQEIYTLKRAINVAKANHPALNVEKYKVTMTETDIISARLRPNIVLNNQSLFQVNPNYFPENTTYFGASNRQIWWQVTKTFQLPSIRRAKIELAQKNKVLAQKNYIEIERNLLLEVALLWSEIWTTQKNLDLLTSAKLNNDKLVNTNERKLKNQVITETDLLRTELLSQQFEVQIQTIQQNYLNNYERLKLLLNKNPQDSILIDFQTDILPNENITFDTLLGYAAGNRADLVFAQKNIEFAQTNIKAQQAFAKTSPEIGLIYNPQNTLPYPGFYATYELPIFSRNQGEIQKAKIYKAQADESLKLVERQINVEISTTFKFFEKQKQNLEKYKDVLNKSRTILDNVQYAYLRGGTTIVDFLEAQRSMMNTQQQYFDILKDFRESYIRLLYVSGRINELGD